MYYIFILTKVYARGLFFFFLICQYTCKCMNARIYACMCVCMYVPYVADIYMSSMFRGIFICTFLSYQRNICRFSADARFSCTKSRLGARDYAKRSCDLVKMPMTINVDDVNRYHPTIICERMISRTSGGITRARK